MNLVYIFKCIFIAGAGYALIQAGIQLQDTAVVKLLEGNGGFRAAANILVVSGVLIIAGQLLDVYGKLRS